MRVDTLSRAAEPSGREWELVERGTFDVLAVGSLAQCREAAWQYEMACWGTGEVPASTYIRPRARRSRAS